MGDDPFVLRLFHREMRGTKEKGVTQGKLEMRSLNLGAFSFILIFLMNMAGECNLDALWVKIKKKKKGWKRERRREADPFVLRLFHREMRGTKEKGVTQGKLEMRSWNLEAFSFLLIFLMNMAAECKFDAIWEKMKKKKRGRKKA